MYTYWAWYGLRDRTTSGIGLAGSNDLVNWHKYSANPVIPVATGASRPSVILDGTTLRMAYENTASTNQVGYATSTNGTTWTIQAPFTSDGDGGFTPALWKNPNDGKFYLYWSSGPLASDGSYPIYVRSAATMEALVTASDTGISGLCKLLLPVSARIHSMRPPTSFTTPPAVCMSSSSRLGRIHRPAMRATIRLGM